jgi:DNA-binding transcriptional LysR family regulator
VGAEIPHKNLVFIKCCEDEIVLIAPKHFEKSEISLDELPKIPLIAREPGSGTWKTALNKLKDKGIYPSELNIVAEMSSTSAVKSGVKVGIGLGFVSKRAIDLELALGLIKLVKIKDFEIKRQFYLVHLKKKRFSPPSEMFYNFLMESLAKRA